MVKEAAGHILRLNEKRNGQGVIFGIDGLPGSRKSTLLRMIGRYLTAQGYYNLMLEGDIFVNLPLLRAVRKKVLGLPLPEELSGFKAQVFSIKENIEYCEVKSLFYQDRIQDLFRAMSNFLKSSKAEMKYEIAEAYDPKDWQKKKFELLFKKNMIIGFDWMFAFTDYLKDYYDICYRMEAYQRESMAAFC